MSSFARSKPVTSRFCARRSLLFDFGITAMFLRFCQLGFFFFWVLFDWLLGEERSYLCVANRSKTCEGVLLCFSAILLITSESNSEGRPTARSRNAGGSSRNDCGPKDE